MPIRKFTVKTIRGFKIGLGILSNYLAQTYQIDSVEDVKTAHIKSYFAHQLQKRCKATYLNGQLKIFRAFFKYLTAQDYLNVNSTLKVDWLREEKTIIRTFNDLEVKKMSGAYTRADFISIRTVPSWLCYLILEYGVMSCAPCRVMR